MATEDSSGLVQSSVRRYSNLALDVPRNELISLEGADDATVETVRPRCATLEVRCPVDGCTSPELSATVGYARADGTRVTAYFSHKSGGGDGGHGPVGFAKATIKHAIRDWAKGLGFDAAVDLAIPAAQRAVDVAIDGPANFAIGVSVTAHDEEALRDHLFAIEDVGMVARWLWLAPSGSCVESFSLRRLIVHGDRLDPIWVAGLDGETVKLAAVGGSARQGRYRPTWLDLASVGLDVDGFVDLTRPATRPDDHPSGAVIGPPAFDDRARRGRPGEPDLFSSLDGNDPWATPAVSWSPEELAVPGTRWMRDLLHDRRHQQFLDGVPPTSID